MKGNTQPVSTIFVIFGAAGDLTQRKLIPALYNLFIDGWLPEAFHVFGVDRAAMDPDAFREHLREGVNRFSRRGKADEQLWEKFGTHLIYDAADLDTAEAYSEVKRKLSEMQAQWSVQPNRVFYLALPPSMIAPIARRLADAGLNQDHERDRIVVEKPFGRDLASAMELNRLLTGLFQESQIFRIDHYLGKETVQNILAFRFANTLFEPIWNRRYIDHIQITVAEQVGVGHRGGYYDHAARGQYGAGWIEGEHVESYRIEPEVDPESSTETYAAVNLFVDNWRWQGVPFYLRTGKRLPARISEVSIQFRPVPPDFSRCGPHGLAPQQAAHRHPARRRHSLAVRGETSGSDHAPFSGVDAVLLP